MKKEILHINIPFFLSSVESLYDHSLKGRPFIIASSDSLYSPVLEISETAYRAGIRRDMTVAEAKTLEKDTLIIRPDNRKYTRVLSAIESLIGRFTPIYEILPTSETYMDIRGTGRAFGAPEDLALRLFREIYYQTGLRSHIGIGSSKLISKAAASFFNTDALLRVINGSEQTFISPMSVRILPGTDKWILQRFSDYGIFKVGDITRFSTEELCAIFGKSGNLFKLWSCGTDIRPIFTKNHPLIREETVISYEENSYETLSKKIFFLASDIGFRLRERRCAAGRFRLVITYTDNISAEGYSGAKPKINTDISIYRLLRALFYRIRTRRINIKDITAEASLLSPVFAQQELISLPQSRERRLFSAIDTIRKRFGDSAIRFGIEDRI